MRRITEQTRNLVRARAGERCEYCLKPDIVTTYGYHVDHVIPVLHGGTSEPNNLAWSCFYCNVAKGRDIASYDMENHTLTPLFNPRTHRWADHFEFDGPTIAGRTAIGRVTVRVLALNQSIQVDIRAELMAAGLW